MASNPHGTSCMRLIHHQWKKSRQSSTSIFRSSPSSAYRFSHVPLLLSANATTNPPIPPQSPAPNPVSPAKSDDSKADVSPFQGARLSLAAAVRKTASATTETYIAYGACDILVRECARHADYTIPQALEKKGVIPKTSNGEDVGVGSGPWYEDLNLIPTFNTWAQVTFLHMYAMTVRLRSFPAMHAPTWHQHLLDHFFYNAEERMVKLHKIQARGIRNKYLKDLFVQWRGLTAAYDEGLARGSDAVLATAVWRNVFKADEEVDLRRLGIVVSYLRGIIKGLEEMTDEAIACGEVAFGDLRSQREGVLARSSMMLDGKGGVTGILRGINAGGGGGGDGKIRNRKEDKTGKGKVEKPAQPAPAQPAQPAPAPAPAKPLPPPAQPAPVNTGTIASDAKDLLTKNNS